MRRSSPLIAVAVLTLTFSSCTCGSSTPDAPPPLASSRGKLDMLKRAEPAAPDVPQARIAPQGAEARSAPSLPTAATNTTLPDDFPSDVPLYKDAKVSSVQALPNHGHSVVFTVDQADPGEVFDFYKGDMGRSGWKTDQEHKGKDQSFLSFKKDKTVTYVQITRDPASGKQVVAVMYFREEPLPFDEF